MRQQLQKCFADMKKKCGISCTLNGNSGLGWDEENQIPTAPNTVWYSYSAAHPDAKPYRRSHLLFQEKLPVYLTHDLRQ